MTLALEIPSINEHSFVMPQKLLAAVQAGTKTRHSIPVRVVPEGRLDLMEIVDPSGNVSYRRPEGHPMLNEARATPGYAVRTVRAGLLLSSPWQVGDKILIREALQRTPQGWVYQLDNTPVHLADDSVYLWQAKEWMTKTDRFSCRASHMPRFACRTAIQITGVDVHPVQDMINRAEDCIAEGITLETDEVGSVCGWYGSNRKHRTAWCPYSYMFDDLYRRQHVNWRDNPIVYAYTFKLVDPDFGHTLHAQIMQFLRDTPSVRYTATSINDCLDRSPAESSIGLIGRVLLDLVGAGVVCRERGPRLDGVQDGAGPFEYWVEA